MTYIEYRAELQAIRDRHRALVVQATVEREREEAALYQRFREESEEADHDDRRP